MNLTVKGTQEFLGKQIPVIEGGFGEGKRCILVNDIARTHGIKVKHINEMINKNLEEFEVGVDILDLKNGRELDHIFQEVGMTKSQITKNRNIYLLSESGYMGLCMLMKGRTAREIRKQFRREYFAMRATLIEQAEYIKVLEEKNALLEERARLIEQRDSAVSEINKLNAICEIPRTQLKKDIRIFMNGAVKDAIFSSTPRIEVYKAYRESRKHREVQPPRSLFDDIVSELGYHGNGDYWIDIVMK